MRDGAGMGQDKTMRGGDEDPIHQPRPAPPRPIAIPIHAKKAFWTLPTLHDFKSNQE